MRLQHKFVTAALIAALSLLCAVGVREANAGSPSGTALTAKIRVTARVLERTDMKVLHQIEKLTVTNADIGRGYIEIPAATRVIVRSNNPAGYLLAFEDLNGTDSIFDSLRVVVGGREARLSANGGWVRQPSIHGGVTLDVSYCFVLSKNAQPGTYTWPLMVSVQPIEKK